MSTAMDTAQHFGFRDVTHRADLFDQIAGLIRSWESERQVALQPESSPAGSDPYITIVDRRVVCNGHALDLARRPLTLRLFESFMAKEQPYLTRDQVLDVLYGSSIRQGKSQRYLASLHANAVKVVSRARIMAGKNLSAGIKGRVHWFVREAGDDGWWLYRWQQGCGSAEKGQQTLGPALAAANGLNHRAI